MKEPVRQVFERITSLLSLSGSVIGYTLAAFAFLRLVNTVIRSGDPIITQSFFRRVPIETRQTWLRRGPSVVVRSVLWTWTWLRLKWSPTSLGTAQRNWPAILQTPTIVSTVTLARFTDTSRPLSIRVEFPVSVLRNGMLTPTLGETSQLWAALKSGCLVISTKVGAGWRQKLIWLR